MRLAKEPIIKFQIICRGVTIDEENKKLLMRERKAYLFVSELDKMKKKSESEKAIENLEKIIDGRNCKSVVDYKAIESKAKELYKNSGEDSQQIANNFKDTLSDFLEVNGVVSPFLPKGGQSESIYDDF